MYKKSVGRIQERPYKSFHQLLLDHYCKSEAFLKVSEESVIENTALKYEENLISKQDGYR